jgi:hypothetical protein
MGVRWWNSEDEYRTRKTLEVSFYRRLLAGGLFLVHMQLHEVVIATYSITRFAERTSNVFLDFDVMARETLNHIQHHMEKHINSWFHPCEPKTPPHPK